MGQVEHPAEPGERPSQSLGEAADQTSGEAGQLDEEIQPTRDAGGPQPGALAGAAEAGQGGTSISDDAERAIQDIQDRREGGG